MNYLTRFMNGIILVLLLAVAPFRAVAAADPHIARIEPDNGMGGAHISIHGSGFGSFPDLVRIGLMQAQILNWSDSRIEVAVLPGTVSGALSVRRGRQWSNPVRFTVPSPQSVDNGIVVSQIKVYDDQALQEMLNSARKQLAGLQVFDQGSIISRLGALQGASSQQSGFGLNVGGPPVPGVQTTANTGNTNTMASLGTSLLQNTGNAVLTTSQGTNTQATSGNQVLTLNGSNGTQTNTGSSTGTQITANTSGQLVMTGPSTQTTTTGSSQLAVTGPSNQNTTTTNSQAQTTGPSTQTVTTQAPITPPNVTAPTTSGFTLPSTFNVSASNILNEEMQLSSEIMGYEMLLEGSLSDHFLIVNGDHSLVKPRATIGVPITIRGGYQDAVAEVVLEVTPTARAIRSDVPPDITAILPREKTYNVAAVTNKSAMIGGGIATQVMTAGVSFLGAARLFT